MPAREGGGDFLAAFGIGAVLGLGAVLLLSPPSDPRRRLVRRARRHTKRLGGRAERTRKAAVRAARAGVGATDEAIETGRALMAEFRAEVERVLRAARAELDEIAAAHPRHGHGAPRDDATS